MIKIEDYMDHICMPTIDGNIHIIPKVTFEKIVSGTLGIEDVDDWQIIFRSILKEFMQLKDW